MTTNQFLEFLNSKPTHSATSIKDALKNVEIPKTAELIKEVDFVDRGHFRVDKLKKYDIVKVQTFGSMHFLLIHKVVNNLVYGLILTSKDLHHSILRVSNDRRFSGGYITNTYISVPLEDCLKKFVSVYENKKEANEAFQKTRQVLKNIL